MPIRPSIAPAGRDQVVFTPGSNAAGKSTAIRHLAADQRSLAILDTTFSNLAHARRILNQALAAGKPVHILYIRRPLSEAFEGMLVRAAAEGRVVSIAQMIASDAGAANVMRKLSGEYAGDPRVQFHYIDNAATGSREADLPQRQNRQLLGRPAPRARSRTSARRPVSRWAASP